MFAALNSVELHVQNLTVMDLFFQNEEWAKVRRPAAEKLAQSRLDGVAASLAGRDYLEGQFTAGDLLMVTVLRLLRHTRMVADNPVLGAYQARCESRPAFQRALAAQLAPFERYAPAA
jgi:glutathione S-transferase